MASRALWLAPCLAIFLGLMPVQAGAADARLENLKAVRERINKLQRELARNTESKANVADQLRAAETAISAANRRLHQLGDQRAAVTADLTRIEQQSQHVSAQIEQQQQQLSQLLYRQQISGEQDALMLLLGGSDPNQMGRDRYYLVLLSRAKAQLLDDLRNALTEKRQLADNARARKEELAEIGRKQAQDRAALLEQQMQRQRMLARISDKIKAQRQEIGTLKANESRLSKLIAGLSRIHRKPARGTGKPGKSETPALSNQQTPETSSFHGAFASLRGKLRLPIKGDITNRFGSPRGEGGMTWKGLFIRASEGSEVRAIAAGRVVFADWLRGFGNLLILDHGDGYLSIYGNNQSLLRVTGDDIKAGDAVAAVGTSGGNPESGLYFELRQQGQPVDPLKWASLR